MSAATQAPPSNILVPVDFSECSRRAALYAAMLAKSVGARVELLHVWQGPHDSADLSDWWETLSDSERASRSLASYITACEQGPLNELAVAVKLAGAREVTTCLEKGTPTRVILSRVKEFDLVVLGTHGRSGVADFFLGSVAERISRRSPIPVLMVPTPDADS